MIQLLSNEFRLTYYMSFWNKNMSLCYVSENYLSYVAYSLEIPYRNIIVFMHAHDDSQKVLKSAAKVSKILADKLLFIYCVKAIQ